MLTLPPWLSIQSTFFFGSSRPAMQTESSPDQTTNPSRSSPATSIPAARLSAQSPRKIAVRPGEKAELSLELYGPAENPVFRFSGFLGFGKTECAFNARIAADERLVCRDGRSWKVEKCRDGAVVREGMLKDPFPVLDSSRGFEFSATVPEGESCSVDLMKTYIAD
jgi:hypothetical protein